MTSPSGNGTVLYFGLSEDNTVDAFINWGVKWGSGGVGFGTVVTYSFPQSSQNWFVNYRDGEPFNGFQGFNPAQQDATRQALALWSDVANISFQEVPDTTDDVGDIRFGFTSVLTNSDFVAWGYFPEFYPEAGDVWFDPGTHPTSRWRLASSGFRPSSTKSVMQ